MNHYTERLKGLIARWMERVEFSLRFFALPTRILMIAGMAKILVPGLSTWLTASVAVVAFLCFSYLMDRTGMRKECSRARMEKDLILLERLDQLKLLIQGNESLGCEGVERNLSGERSQGTE